ncbi:MAG: hypothetical protein HY674_10230 [Chloroflexi bacterium]|nr:hypothetical protein [Chloroflexota bacterium]
MTPALLNAADTRYPARLRERLGDTAPAQVFALGNLNVLALPKTALFCSTRCPGQAILRAYDQAAKWRDEGRCVISGFHSPVEKECLRILMRGPQPIIICPARASARHYGVTAEELDFILNYDINPESVRGQTPPRPRRRRRGGMRGCRKRRFWRELQHEHRRVVHRD